MTTIDTRHAVYPTWPTGIPDLHLEAGSYLLRFARTPEDLDRVLRLRYDIFNLELGEGLDQSHATGRDEDELDARFHHLIIQRRDTHAVVGTYRMQTAEMALAGGGFYADPEFDLSSLPGDVRDAAIEIGRACIAKEHRNGRVLHLLWRGLAAYLAWNKKVHVFGCCSLTSQDPALGVAVHQHLVAGGSVHPALVVAPRPGSRCEVLPGQVLPDPHVPALFQSYLHLGAKVLGPPAIDRSFKTIDWLVILDTREFDPATYRNLFR